MRRLALIGALALTWVSSAFGGEIQFVEDFALAKDRAQALKQLIPGTEDYYYYHSLYYLQAEQFEKIDPLLASWVQRFGETQRVWEIRTRQALATYDKNPARSLEFLRGRLGLTFPHQKVEQNAEPNLPTALDPAEITREAFVKRANAGSPDNTDRYEDVALDWLLGLDLNPNQRRSLLSRLARPDYDKLVKLVIDDLNHERSGGFGSLGIHRQLLLAQLEELLKAKPDLLNQQNYVATYLARLQPTADEDWRHDPQRLEAYLDRLSHFVNRLSASHNSLKSHVLYHRLVLDRQRGELNKERFIEYLKLPRRSVGYLSKRMLESDAYNKFPSDLNANFGGVTLLPAIGVDEPLVRSYLLAFLVEAPNFKEFEPYISDVYLQSVFAEAKIVNGLGDPEQWAALLPPAVFQQLKERVDLDFAATNKTQFAVDELVKLDLSVKNVNTLIVKVFEINTQNYYRNQLREVDTDISLDGLVANSEKTYTLQDPPLRRTARKYEFPQLDKPGIYVIDFIGNGKGSRALIRKGRLRHFVRTSAMGQVFTVFNERGEQVKDARIWMAGHEYQPETNGSIVVPFSSSAGRQPIVISQGGFSSLDYFQQEAENYSLTTAFHVDRESLLSRRTVQLLVRPGLQVNGTPVSVNRLLEPKLTIVSTDIDGIASMKEAPDFKLFEDRETVYEFQTPDRLASLEFRLTAKVKRLSAGGEQLELQSSDSVTLNGIDKTEKIEQPQLAKYGDAWFIELRGKTGEAKTSRPINIAFKHRDFRLLHSVTLKTDGVGRIKLGALNDIASLSVTTPQGVQQGWTLKPDAYTYLQTLHGKAGEAILVAYLGQGETPNRAEVSLLELRNDLFVADRFAHLAIKDGFLVVSQLPPGDYDLLLKASGSRMRIRVTDGSVLNGFVMGSYRQLEVPKLPPLQIESVKPTADGVAVRLKNSGKFSRVHVFATRYAPEYDAFAKLAKVHGPEPYLYQQTPAESVYLTGRNIGDEYRYIIDRKYVTKFPGNTLDRPSLLLNPWVVRSTETGEQQIAAGDDFAAAGAKPASSALRRNAEEMAAMGLAANFANLDYLAHASAVLLNLVPDEQGVINVKNDALGGHQQIHIVAADPLNVVYRSISLPEKKTSYRDLRLTEGLAPKEHFTQQKLISLIPQGQPFVINDVSTARFEVYDSLKSVYRLYGTLNSDPKLFEFSFILNWPNLKPDEKRALYSKYASHELSFFLARKDPEFFQAVVKPHVANKKDKEFIDRYLLEEDLSAFLSPWNYERLNVVEQILLASRIRDERANTARHVTELVELRPFDIDQFSRLFEFSLKQKVLDVGGAGAGLGFPALHFHTDAALVEEKLQNSFSSNGPAAPPGAAPAPMAANGAVQFGNRARLKESLEQKAERGAAVDRDEKQAAAAKRMMGRRSDGELDKAKDAQPLGDEGGKGGGKGEEKRKLDEADRDGVDSLWSESLEERRVRQLYRKLEKTQELAENNYHHMTIDQQNGQLITANSFWKDFALHDPATPFLSRNLAEAARNFPEMMLALAVTDLPFESPKHETKLEGIQLTMTPGGSLVVFHEEIKPSAPADGAAKVLISQNFYRHGERTRLENGEQVDLFINDEYLAQVVYGCQIVVTNPTSARQKLNLLTQIPLGAIAVQGSQATKTVQINLEPYHTQTVDFYFYFPLAGQYPCFPAHVAKNETLLASASPILMNVVDKPSKVDTDSWDYVSQLASTEDVLTFLDKHNIASLNLDRIAWRMHDAKVFAAVISKLSKHHVYQHTLWSYALKHDITAAAREYLLHADQIVRDCGGRLKSTLLAVDPIRQRMAEHLEYSPLVNARAHALGHRRQIVNERFRDQYHQTLRQLSYERTLNDDDLLTVTYYLLLQDRIEEALQTFARVNAGQVASKIQYDYCAAYLDFFTENHQRAAATAAKYVDYPVDRWRKTFAAITAQLDEAEGKSVKPTNEEDRNQQMAELAATEATFDFNVESGQVNLDYRNLKKAQINIYEVDIELLFSRNPFVQQFHKQFSSIKPNHTIEVDLPDNVADASSPAKGLSTKVIPLPAAIKAKNVVVEVVGAGRSSMRAYYAHSLSVQVIENYGEVKVTHQSTGKPVSKAYVKVYALGTGGKVKFYKDGYTDLRGRFEYASLNTDDLDSATKFSILILSDENGAVVREATPPKS